MMFAEGEYLDILDYNHFIMILIKHRPINNLSPINTFYVERYLSYSPHTPW